MSRLLPAAVLAMAVQFTSPVKADPLDATAGADRSGVDEIVVRATRTERDVARVPAAVSIVGAEDIQLGRQQLGLDESLAAVPGVFLQDRYNFAQDLRIAIRGFGARSNFGIRGVRIIVDGIPASLPDGQAQSDGIDIGSIERIEVLRGASSSLYGNASGGVINIETERGTSVPFVETRLAAGAYDFRQYQLKAGGAGESWSYRFNVADLDFDGYRAHSETENRQFNGRVLFQPSDRSEFGFTLGLTDQPLANDPGGVTLDQLQTDPRSARQRNVDFDSGEALEQQKLGLSFRRRFAENHVFRVRNYYVFRNFSNRLPFVSGGAVEFDRLFAGGGASYIYSGDFLGRNNSLIVGFDFDRQQDDRLRFNNNNGTRGAMTLDQRERVTSTGVFVQNEIELTGRLGLTIGLRADEVRFSVADRFLADGDDSGSRTLSEVSPMVGVTYALTSSTSVYGTISSAFETPTTTELADPTGGGGFNASLQPQRATNYEVGLKIRAGTSNTYELSLFDMQIDDELTPLEVASQPGRDFFENAGASSRRGLEAGWVGRPLPGLRLSAAYTYSDFDFDRFSTAAGSDFSGNSIPGIPRHLFRAELFFQQSDGFFAGVDYLSVGDFFADNANTASVEGYRVANFRAGHAWTLGVVELAPYVGVNNLLDESYPANVRINAFGGRFYEAAPARHAFAGLAIRYNFGATR